MWSYVWVFSLISLANVSVFMPRPCGLYYYSPEGQLEIGNGETSSISSMFGIVLAILVWGRGGSSKSPLANAASSKPIWDA